MALRRAARVGDGWIGAGNTPAEVPALMETLRTLRKEAGRGDRPFETLIGLYADAEVDLFRRMEDEGMTSGIHLPFWFEFDGPSTIRSEEAIHGSLRRRDHPVFLSVSKRGLTQIATRPSPWPSDGSSLK